MKSSNQNFGDYGITDMSACVVSRTGRMSSKKREGSSWQ